MFINNQQDTEDIKREIKKFIETNNNGNTTTQNLFDTAIAILRGKFFNNTILPQEIRKISKWEPNFTPKVTGKIRIKKAQNY